jgi:predicted O-methyltransferase YrrM
MSHESTPVSAAHFDYIRSHCEAEDALLRELKDAARAAGIPAIWIAPEQARLLQILLRAARAREVVEVGTLAGYSALVMARALGSGGRVRTIEVSAQHAAFAREWIARAAPQAAVEVLLGPGAAVLPTFADHSADAMFVDADKAGYPLYLEQALRIVRPGGLVLVDNAFAFGQLLDAHPTDRGVPHVRAFNELMARCERLEKVIVPVGDGLWVAIVR